MMTDEQASHNDKKEARLGIRLPAGLHQAALAEAQRRDLTLSQVIRWYLYAWIWGDAPLYPPAGGDQL